MGRPMNPDLRTEWYITIPATLAGRVTVMLPAKYGTRSKLIAALLERWLHEQDNVNPAAEAKLQLERKYLKPEDELPLLRNFYESTKHLIVEYD